MWTSPDLPASRSERCGSNSHSVAPSADARQTTFPSARTNRAPSGETAMSEQ